MNKSKTIGSFIIIGLSLAVFISFMIFNYMRLDSAKNRLGELDLKIAGLKGREETLSFDVNSKSSKQKAEVMGVDSERVKKDTNISKKFFETTLKWNSLKEYNEARKNGMKLCSSDVSDTYFKTFMPKIDTVVREVPNGINKTKKVKTNKIDSGKLRSSYGGADVRLIDYNKNTYNYLTIASMKTTKNNNSVTGRIAVTYSVDDTGKIRNVAVYPISGYFD